ncbi:MAG TPA: hypothetical protein VI434_14950 [Candidatus Dormibacteraeota bacterium]
MGKRVIAMCVGAVFAVGGTGALSVGATAPPPTGCKSKVGQMRTPQGLAFAPNGPLYIVEENNNRLSAWTVPS